VYELSKRPARSTEVDEMERALVAAGCARSGWTDNLRLRGDLVVMWQSLEKSGRSLDAACKELDWCGLSWRAPSADQIKTLGADPWFGETTSHRCVASVPEP